MRTDWNSTRSSACGGSGRGRPVGRSGGVVAGADRLRCGRGGAAGGAAVPRERGGAGAGSAGAGGGSGVGRSSRLSVAAGVGHRLPAAPLVGRSAGRHHRDCRGAPAGTTSAPAWMTPPSSRYVARGRPHSRTGHADLVDRPRDQPLDPREGVGARDPLVADGHRRRRRRRRRPVPSRAAPAPRTRATARRRSTASARSRARAGVPGRRWRPPSGRGRRTAATRAGVGRADQEHHRPDPGEGALARAGDDGRRGSSPPLTASRHTILPPKKRHRMSGTRIGPLVQIQITNQITDEVDEERPEAARQVASSRPGHPRAQAVSRSNQTSAPSLIAVIKPNNVGQSFSQRNCWITW